MEPKKGKGRGEVSFFVKLAAEIAAGPAAHLLEASEIVHENEHSGNKKPINLNPKTSLDPSKAYRADAPATALEPTPHAPASNARKKKQRPIGPSAAPKCSFEP